MLKINMKTKRAILMVSLVGLGLGAFSMTSSFVSGILGTAVPVVGNVESALGLLALVSAGLMLNRQL